MTNLNFAPVQCLILSCILLLASCSSSAYTIKPVDLSSDVVIVYTSSWCRSCAEARQFLIKHKIDFVELDYENEAEFARLLKISHQLEYNGIFDSVPVFIVKKNILVGYSPDTILWILSGAD